jgi:hypothetical protein
MNRFFALSLVMLGGVFIASTGRLSGQSAAPGAGTPSVEWRTYGGDLASTRASLMQAIEGGA